MKTIMFVLIVLLICSVLLNGYFFLQDYKEEKRLEKLIYANEDVPEFMKNGEWLDIILNGYKGER